jgi:DNA (cytosine-5)-methyltransferase 1
MVKYNTLELFCGAGGMGIGFEQAGFNVAAANDFWPIATETFKINNPKTKVITGDITKSKVHDEIIAAAGKIDVITGGPPCQAYSLAGARNPDDPRGKLFEEYVKIVERLRPKIFVMENVKGILTMMHYKEALSMEDEKELKCLRERESEIASKITASKKSPLPESDWLALKSESALVNSKLAKFKEPVTELIQRRFLKLGYKIRWKLLNAADYGVPQLRERVFFVGTLDGISFEFPKPTHSEHGGIDALGRPLKKWVSIKEALKELPSPSQNPEDELFEGSFSSIYMSRNRRKCWDEPSFTIQAGARHAPLHPSSPEMSKVGVDKWEFISDNGIRRLSFREIARIQTFPDGYNFVGKIADKYKQIGNAVPCLLARKVAEEVKKSLDACYN